MYDDHCAVRAATDSFPPPSCTHCAPAERAPLAEVEKQRRFFSALPYIQQLFDAISTMVLVINDSRQIVFCNRHMLAFLGVDRAADLLGQRPGEALSCVHGTKPPAGCGTTEFCQTCGAVSAILAANSGGRAAQECRMTRYGPGGAESLELMVQATRIETEIGNFVLLSIQDISHERRRRSLEKIFFHDILNTVGAILGCADLIRMSDPDDASKYAEIICDATEQVLGEIHAQKDLLAAENNELRVTRGIVNTVDFLRGVARLFAGQEAARDRNIVVDPSCAEVLMETDSVILGRVIGNMVKNALEASAPGETVTVSSETSGDRVWFRVHNAAYMSQNVQRQVFTRSFSTKGGARGMGTYGMKLLTERYLQGSVGFVSNQDEGTTFFAHYPVSL